MRQAEIHFTSGKTLYTLESHDTIVEMVSAGVDPMSLTSHAGVRKTVFIRNITYIGEMSR